MTHRSRSEMEKRNQASGHSRPTAETQPGGREFGQVIEPMQAEMASGNEGLTDSSSSKRSSGATAKPHHGAKRRKAA